MAFLYGGKSGYHRYDCNGNDVPANCRNGKEEQESCQLIGYSMRDHPATLQNRRPIEPTILSAVMMFGKCFTLKIDGKDLDSHC